MSDRDDESDERPIEGTYEKMGILWLTDLHRKLESIRSLQMQLANDFTRKSELEQLNLVTRIDMSLHLLLEQEIRPLAENRGAWESFQEEIDRTLRERGIEKIAPADDDYYGKFFVYVNVTLGRIEKSLEEWGLKITPYPPQEDIVAQAWEIIVVNARTDFQREVTAAMAEANRSAG